MKCDYINLFFHDYVDGYLSTEQSRVIEMHAAKCKPCHQNLQQIREQINELANLNSPSVSVKYVDRTIDKVENHYHQKKLKAAKKPVYLSIAASFLLVSTFTFTLWFNKQDVLINSQTSINTAKIFSTEKKINMVFKTPKALENVRFTVTLPNNVEMVGHPGKRQVIWFGALSAGSNLLSIPVVSNAVLSGTLFTKLEYENNSKVFQVKMDHQNNKPVKKA